MRAALLQSVGRLVLTEVEQPVLQGPTEVLIQVQAIGICGSEIHAFKGTHPFRKPPCVLGHEVGGLVVEVGTGVKGLAPGDRVFVDPQWPCGACDWCRSGRHNLCPSKKVLGTLEWSGGLGEYIVAPESSVYPLPDYVSFVAATLIEPLSVAVHMADRAGVASGQSVAVLGAGPIGMMVASVARVRGAAPVIAVDVQQHCLDIVQSRLGATHGLLAGDGPLADRIQRVNGGQGVSTVFVTVGVPALVEEALKMVERDGKVMFVALFDQPITLCVNDLIAHDLTLLGSQMYDGRDIRMAMDLVATGQVQAEAMVSHVLPLYEAQRGFELAASKADHAVKVVLEFG